MVKERPILFSAPTVLANRAGRKTQTRRIVKPMKDPDARCELAPCEIAGEPKLWGRLSPYGVPGDRLWTREAWRTGSKLDQADAAEIAKRAREAGYSPDCPIKYEADGAIRVFGDNDPEDFGDWGRYRHARFMPRWASRDLLEVVNVRVERVQSISAADAIAEGVQIPVSTKGAPKGKAYPLLTIRGPLSPSEFKASKDWDEGDYYRFEYALLWCKINGVESWRANPFVWVVEYRRLSNAA